MLFTRCLILLYTVVVLRTLSSSDTHYSCSLLALLGFGLSDPSRPLAARFFVRSAPRHMYGARSVTPVYGDARQPARNTEYSAVQDCTVGYGIKSSGRT